MKKMFIVAGELSGDRLAAWYVRKVQEHGPCLIEAIGGDFLASENVTLYKRFEELNVVGIVQILRHIPRLVRMMHTVCDYIAQQAFNEVVLVDFPGFNLRLAKLLKKKLPSLTVTYVSPPQLWCWGAWRINALKQFTDRVIVMYPFEVAWYRQRGLRVEWIGSPVYDALRQYSNKGIEKKSMIALIPGSRKSEIKELLPIFLLAARKLLARYPALTFIVPQARSIDDACIRNVVRTHDLEDVWSRCVVVQQESEKYQKLSHCCAALSKPGTSTLELGLLYVPTIVAFKTDWVSYTLGRMLVTVDYMGLPNLLLGREIFKECIQYDCTVDRLADELERIYNLFLHDQQNYHERVQALSAVVDCIKNGEST